MLPALTRRLAVVLVALAALRLVLPDDLPGGVWGLNALVALVAWVVPGFTIAGFWTAVGTAVIVSVVSWAATGLIGSSGKFEKFPASR